MIAFAELLSKGAQGRSLGGDLNGAEAWGEYVEQLWKGGLLDSNPATALRIRSRIREPRRAESLPESDEADFLHRTANEFGNLSEEHLGELKCRACRAVLMRSPSASDRIQEARIAYAEATAKHPDRANILKREEKDLAFIELTFRTRDLDEEPDRLSAFLRKEVGLSNLRALLRKTKAPLRKAVICYWMWYASDKEDFSLLHDAWVFLEERRSVQYLCVLQVAGFREKLRNLLGSL